MNSETLVDLEKTEHSSHPSAWRMCVNAVAAACIAEATTLPVEVAKVRLQLQKARACTTTPLYDGLWRTMRTITRQESWTGLFKGLEAGMHKQILYAGLRLGLYDHFTSDEDASVPAKIACAVMTTGIGIVVSNPSDVVQVKYMAYSKRTFAAPPPVVAPPPVQVQVPAASPEQRAQSRKFGAIASLRVDDARPCGRGVTVPTAPSTSAATGAPCAVYSASSHAYSRGSWCWRGPQAFHHFSACLPGGSRDPSWIVPRFLYHDHRRRLHAASICSSMPPNAADARGGAGGPKTITGVPLRSARHAYYVISKEEGFFKGLYRGFGANFACSSIQGATEIATYDHTKQLLLGAGFEDSAPVHLGAGIMAGLMATLLSNPFDIVATRLMAGKLAHKNDGTTMMAVAANMLKHEGIMGFYKGCTPNMIRIGCFNVVMWLSYEQIRRIGW